MKAVVFVVNPSLNVFSDILIDCLISLKVLSCFCLFIAFPSEFEVF